MSPIVAVVRLIVRGILATFCCDYVQTYGMTETSPYLTLSLLTPELQRLPPEQQLLWKCKTGRPFAGVALRVVDDAGTPVAADGKTVGEIRVKGPTVTPGYWQNPEATAAKSPWLSVQDSTKNGESGFGRFSASFPNWSRTIAFTSSLLA